MVGGEGECSDGGCQVFQHNSGMQMRSIISYGDFYSTFFRATIFLFVVCLSFFFWEVGNSLCRFLSMPVGHLHVQCIKLGLIFSKGTV